MAQTPASKTDETPELSIVVPAFNEARRLGPTLAAIRQYIERQGLSAEVLVVDDGSSDGTAQVACGVPEVIVVNSVGGLGKGFCVRRGMLVATGRQRLMCDADLATPIEELDKLRAHLKPRGPFDVVIGSRDLPDSRLEPPQGLPRRLLARAFRQVRRGLMLRDLRDTQCGFKLFTAEAADRIFPLQQEDGFIFDCEVLALARALGLAIKEVGVVWHNDRDSRVRPLRDGPGMLLRLFAIARRARALSNAPKPAVTPAAGPPNPPGSPGPADRRPGP